MGIDQAKIRIENQPGIQVSSYAGIGVCNPETRPFSILFINPFQHVGKDLVYSPPLGILALVGGLRRYFGNLVTIHFWDMMVYNQPASMFSEQLEELNPDVVAVSALSCDEDISRELAAITKKFNKRILTVLGGAITLRQAERLLKDSVFDWLFEGPADRTFLSALERHFSGREPGCDIPGFSHRLPDGTLSLNTRQDLITDLDSLPMPAWDLVDFDRYRRRDRPYMLTNVDELPYANLFTSRGCPYLCTYCHDIFTKRFVYQSEETVLEQIRVLHEDYGICDFHIIDDIFNLHKPRVQSIMNAIAKRWNGKIRIAFPNGIRGDILDEKTIEAMVTGGTYQATIAIETVTPRLQKLAEKHLNVERALWAAQEFAKRGVTVNGNFMLGFPTETRDEIQATLDCAVESPFSQVWMTAVLPQPGTPIHDLAMQVSPEACAKCTDAERDASPYLGVQSWYSAAYNYNLYQKIFRTYLKVYLYPPRVRRLWGQYPKLFLAKAFAIFLVNMLAAHIPGSDRYFRFIRGWKKTESPADYIVTTRGASARPRHLVPLIRD
jgi:anaerobic magnesium-protoporphyrin IX monomethyl ester cyclase